jgi:hypothetical protein
MSTTAAMDISHTLDAAASELPDFAEWELRPKTQMIAEKAAAACPYLGGSEQNLETPVLSSVGAILGGALHS